MEGILYQSLSWLKIDFYSFQLLLSHVEGFPAHFLLREKVKITPLPTYSMTSTKCSKTNNKYDRKWAEALRRFTSGFIVLYTDWLEWTFLAFFMPLGFPYSRHYDVVCSPQARTCLWKNSNSDFMLCLTLKLSTNNVQVIPRQLFLNFL